MDIFCKVPCKSPATVDHPRATGDTPLSEDIEEVGMRSKLLMTVLKPAAEVSRKGRTRCVRCTASALCPHEKESCNCRSLQESRMQSTAAKLTADVSEAQY